VPYPDNKTFTITCTMKERWIPHFLGMLKQCQLLGAQGSSRDVTIFADGDGDFRPKFEWPANLSDPAPSIKTDPSGDTYFDAG
jgi:hypothetical protein